MEQGTLVELHVPLDILAALRARQRASRSDEERLKTPLAVGLFAEGTISLAKAARLAGMTRYEFAEVLLPDAVYEEVVLQGHGLPGANETKAAVDDGWLRRVAVQDSAPVDALLGELDVIEHNFRISSEHYEQLTAGG
jgi:Uncharacterised protein family (UPF0175)